MRGIVWAYNTDDAIAKLLEIEEDYDRLGIKPANRVIGKSQTYIVFGNGDMWRVVRASDSGRGYATNVSYIDIRISQETINTIIKPATKSWPFQAFKFYCPLSYKPGEDEEIEPKFI